MGNSYLRGVSARGALRTSRAGRSRSSHRSIASYREAIAESGTHIRAAAIEKSAVPIRWPTNTDRFAGARSMTSETARHAGHADVLQSSSTVPPDAEPARPGT
ncbi:DUF664 domain-containing protein, partial [Actinoplanes campanulatus]